MAPGAPAYQPIIETFGTFVVDPDGRINRERLGAIAFTLPEAMRELESIIHPIVGQAVVALASRAKQRVIVIEAIKLIESDLMRMVDALWVVDASPETQRRRLIDKRNMSPEEALKRIAAQAPQSEKLARARVIIRNEGNVDDTWKQVQTAWTQMMRKAFPDGAAVVKSAAAAPAPTLTRAPGAPSALSPKTAIAVRRGMPNNAEQIARFVSRVGARPMTRMDVMLAFGQKSYILALGDSDQVIGVIGWTVENLITRVDEIYLDPTVPREPVIRALIGAIEEASRDLQSEVSFVFIPRTTPQETVQSFFKNGYQLLRLNEIKFPAWREAAHETLTPELVGLMKQLRADRVMKPI
jgi:dephospho-CoA kinase